MSIDVLYHVILYYVSCFVWTPGRVAAAFATDNEDPNKNPVTDLGIGNMGSSPGQHLARGGTGRQHLKYWNRDI